MKGMFFTLDTMFAISIAIIMVIAINFFLLRVQEDPLQDLYIQKIANSILLTLVKNGTFENPKNATIASAFSAVLPENLGGVLRVTLFRCTDPACNTFTKTTEYRVNKCRTNELDVMLIIDRSGSMCEPVAPVWCNSHPPGSKMADAIVAANLFVDELDSFSDRSGLVSFAAPPPAILGARLDQPLTFDKVQVKTRVSALNALGATAIGDGIQRMNTHVGPPGNAGRPGTVWAAILLSDGENNAGLNPITAANNAAALKIKIYTIGLDIPSGGPAETTMQQIANITGGKYYYAATGNELNAIYLEIANDLMQREFEVTLARTSFVTFTNTTVSEYGIAELRLCLL